MEVTKTNSIIGKNSAHGKCTILHIPAKVPLDPLLGHISKDHLSLRLLETIWRMSPKILEHIKEIKSSEERASVMADVLRHFADPKEIGIGIVKGSYTFDSPHMQLKDLTPHYWVECKVNGVKHFIDVDYGLFSKEHENTILVSPMNEMHKTTTGFSKGPDLYDSLGLKPDVKYFSAAFRSKYHCVNKIVNMLEKEMGF